MADPATLVLDIGGTKTLVALVRGAEVLAEARVATDGPAGPEGWIAAAARAAEPWRGRYGSVAAAVTGLVAGGRWSALNPGVLGIPDGFPLVERLGAVFGTPAAAVNDAQAAAWGEWRHGAGRGTRDMVFVTLSTGIGGGVVIGGRLHLGRGGLAGHVGVTAPVLADGPAHVEDAMAGRWIAAEAARAGHPTDAAGVFAAAEAGEGWAAGIVAEHAARAARLLANLQLLFAPERIVVGGGLGLAPGHLGRLRERLSALPDLRRPEIVGAALGPRAGVVGAADLAQDGTTRNDQQRRTA